MCRVYVERDGETVRKLYITSIEDQDSGSYICSGVVARQRLEKNVTMMLFSAYLFSFHSFSESWCNLCILFYFKFYVTVFIYPASAAKPNKRMWNVEFFLDIATHFLLLARYVPNVAKEEYMRSV